MALCRSWASRLSATSTFESRSASIIRTTRSSTPYSTDATSQPSIHEVQSMPRKRELRKVTEGAGQTAQLIRAAVQNTSNRAARTPGQDSRPRNEARGAVQGGSRPPRAGASAPKAGVAPGMHRAELQRLLAERKAAAARGQTEGAYAPTASGSGPRAGGQRRPASPGGRPRPPRAAGAAGPGTPGGANGAPRPRKPAQPRRPARANSSAPRESSRWSAEEMKPLVPPAHVSLSRANLASLVKASALSESSQLRAALREVGVSVDAKEKAERDQARKVLAGDYSLWLSAKDATAAPAKGAKKDAKKGSEAKGPNVVDQARAALSLNAAIPLKSRQQVLDKIREATV